MNMERERNDFINLYCRFDYSEHSDIWSIYYNKEFNAMRLFFFYMITGVGLAFSAIVGGGVQIQFLKRKIKMFLKRRKK